VAKAFISYKTGAKPDERLAGFFAEYLSARNHDIFIQTKIAPGQTWPSVVDDSLKAADFLIVLLSAESAASEMVIEEVRRGARWKTEQSHPVILPVRVGAEVTLPYDLGAKVNRVQQLKWTADGEENTIAAKLHEVLAGVQKAAGGSEPRAEAKALSADGAAVAPEQGVACPLPAFDVSWLKSLTAEGGPVRLDSPFYVARQHDETCKQRVVAEGSTLLIRGSRQIGKSSLLARLYQHARDNNVRAVYIDFQTFDRTQLQSLDQLLMAFGNAIGDDLNANNLPQDTWKANRTAGQNLTRYIQTEAIGDNPRPLLLLMDEVDRVFAFPDYRDDFFALLRSWDSRRALDARFARLNLVLAYSTEASMFIQNPHQSPFNVGQVFDLNDFSRQEFESLNQKHGSPVKPADKEALVKLVGGHPFLVRQALYELTTSGVSAADLIATSVNDDGPFSGHLQSYMLRFHEYGDLRQPMKSVLQGGICPDDMSFYKLRSIGLVRGPDRTHVSPRCGLYEKYFGARL
jgi:AAA-like domain/TIR domain